MIRTVGPLLLAALAVGVAAGCGSPTDSTAPSTGDSAIAPDTEPAVACSMDLTPTTEAPDTVAPATEPGTEPAVACSMDVTSTTEAPDTTAPDTESAAACSAEAILPVLQSLFPENEAWNVVDVRIADCRNGYARVFAVPDMSSCADPDIPCLESEQVYLRDDQGAWVVVDAGTGVECASPGGLLPETLQACEALGLLP